MKGFKAYMSVAIVICLLANFITTKWLCGFNFHAHFALPTYNLSGGNPPLKVVEEFMEAVINEENEKIGDMLYNYSWDTEYFSAAENVSESDSKIIECVNQSRAYKIVSGSDYLIDSHNAEVTIQYTTFDISRFYETLCAIVIEEIQQMQYEGVVFENESDTVQLIEDEKQNLLQNPNDFITIKNYTIELVSYKGRWLVVLSDEFYSALSGYAV